MWHVSKTSWRLLVLFDLALCASCCPGQNFTLRNSNIQAGFGLRGMTFVGNASSGEREDFTKDSWSITLDGKTLRGNDVVPTVKQGQDQALRFEYNWPDAQIAVTYQIRPGWNFISKRIEVVRAPAAHFKVDKVVVWDLSVKEEIASEFVPSTYTPQFGMTIEKSRAMLPGKDYGVFLRFSDKHGVMLNVQNPFLHVQRDGQTIAISYEPEIDWDQSWGHFESDAGCLGTYELSGRRLAREMVKEWQPAGAEVADDGMDEAEVDAFRNNVSALLENPSPAPISVEVGWTLNDYQIDVGTAEGRAEYKRIIDTTAELGIQDVLYAPGNSEVSDRAKSADTWSWEYVLWLGLGEKIRKGQWDPAKDPIPSSVASMLAYAKGKKVGILAYVYPSVPFAKETDWLVRREKDTETVPETGSTPVYATLASREFQNYLLSNLIAFQKRTGIAGYSFDYTFLNLPGSSSYAQWFGWRRVMEGLRKAVPNIVIDGRQTYQEYGPWSWLAGSYPHPTGNDEQPESFKPFPDLHFDRVSADRARFVNYWYRNYEFAPEQVIPGYATHQTERSRETEVGGQRGVEMMYTRFRPRDWDYLGFKYSFISSIATGGWNNVVDMIPARDIEEFKHFSAEDKAWIRDWLAWTATNRELLLHTRTILQQPALGHVDGTAAVSGDHGFIFLFNPNYKSMPAEFVLDSSIGLSKGDKFVLREIYPKRGRLFGKTGTGYWTMGDVVPMKLDGTSATVLEVEPLAKKNAPILFNSMLSASPAQAVKLLGQTLQIEGLEGEPGSSDPIGVLLPSHARVASARVNGQEMAFRQSGDYIEIPVSFAGERFAQAQQIELSADEGGVQTGTFVVPQRVLDQLSERQKRWPIPWSVDDYQTTWLAPERLLLFIQFASPTDSLSVKLTVDGKELTLNRAFTSTRADSPCFVGFYADLSKIEPNVSHRITLKIPPEFRSQLQGVFFDNVLPQFTQKLDGPTMGAKRD